MPAKAKRALPQAARVATKPSEDPVLELARAIVRVQGDAEAAPDRIADIRASIERALEACDDAHRVAALLRTLRPGNRHGLPLAIVAGAARASAAARAEALARVMGWGDSGHAWNFILVTREFDLDRAAAFVAAAARRSSIERSRIANQIMRAVAMLPEASQRAPFEGLARALRGDASR